MHTSVSYITKLRGSMMKGQISTNQCVVLKMLDKEPPLAQMWVQTCWEYLQSINILNGTLKYGSSCLAHVQVTKLPACDSHLNVWKDILKISR